MKPSCFRPLVDFLGVFLGFLVSPGDRRLAGLDAAVIPRRDQSRCRPTFNNWSRALAPWSIIAAFLISVGVGVVFGLYLAQRAARMDPIEAPEARVSWAC